MASLTLSLLADSLIISNPQKQAIRFCFLNHAVACKKILLLFVNSRRLQNNNNKINNFNKYKTMILLKLITVKFCKQIDSVSLF